MLELNNVKGEHNECSELVFQPPILPLKASFTAKRTNLKPLRKDSDQNLISPRQTFSMHLLQEQIKSIQFGQNPQIKPNRQQIINKQLQNGVKSKQQINSHSKQIKLEINSQRERQPAQGDLYSSVFENSSIIDLLSRKHISTDEEGLELQQTLQYSPFQSCQNILMPVQTHLKNNKNNLTLRSNAIIDANEEILTEKESIPKNAGKSLSNRNLTNLLSQRSTIDFQNQQGQLNNQEHTQRDLDKGNQTLSSLRQSVNITPKYINSPHLSLIASKVCTSLPKISKPFYHPFNHQSTTASATHNEIISNHMFLTNICKYQPSNIINGPHIHNTDRSSLHLNSVSPQEDYMLQESVNSSKNKFYYSDHQTYFGSTNQKFRNNSYIVGDQMSLNASSYREPQVNKKNTVFQSLTHRNEVSNLDFQKNISTATPKYFMNQNSSNNEDIQQKANSNQLRNINKYINISIHDQPYLRETQSNHQDHLKSSTQNQSALQNNTIKQMQVPKYLQNMDNHNPNNIKNAQMLNRNYDQHPTMSDNQSKIKQNMHISIEHPDNIQKKINYSKQTLGQIYNLKSNEDPQNKDTHINLKNISNVTNQLNDLNKPKNISIDEENSFEEINCLSNSQNHLMSLLEKRDLIEAYFEWKQHLLKSKHDMKCHHRDILFKYPQSGKRVGGMSFIHPLKQSNTFKEQGKTKKQKKTGESLWVERLKKEETHTKQMVSDLISKNKIVDKPEIADHKVKLSKYFMDESVSLIEKRSTFKDIYNIYLPTNAQFNDILCKDILSFLNYMKNFFLKTDNQQSSSYSKGDQNQSIMGTNLLETSSLNSQQYKPRNSIILDYQSEPPIATLKSRAQIQKTLYLIEE